MRQQRGFTLIEVAVTILVLFIGLTSALALVITGMDWGDEVRIESLAVETARSVLDNAAILDGSATNDTPSVSGRINGFFVVRERTEATGALAAATGLSDGLYAGKFADVTVTIYTNVVGTDPSTGVEVFRITGNTFDASYSP